MSIPQQVAASAHWDREDIESRIAHVLARKMGRRASGAYRARSEAQVMAQLDELLRDAQV